MKKVRFVVLGMVVLKYMKKLSSDQFYISLEEAKMSKLRIKENIPVFLKFLKIKLSNPWILKNGDHIILTSLFFMKENSFYIRLNNLFLITDRNIIITKWMVKFKTTIHTILVGNFLPTISTATTAGRLVAQTMSILAQVTEQWCCTAWLRETDWIPIKNPSFLPMTFRVLHQESQQVCSFLSRVFSATHHHKRHQQILSFAHCKGSIHQPLPVLVKLLRRLM